LRSNQTSASPKSWRRPSLRHRRWKSRSSMKWSTKRRLRQSHRRRPNPRLWLQQRRRPRRQSRCRSRVASYRRRFACGSRNSGPRRQRLRCRQHRPRGLCPGKRPEQQRRRPPDLQPRPRPARVRQHLRNRGPRLPEARSVHRTHLGHRDPSVARGRCRRSRFARSRPAERRVLVSRTRRGLACRRRVRRIQVSGPAATRRSVRRPAPSETHRHGRPLHRRPWRPHQSAGRSRWPRG
jgi:hypothetical protein